MEPRPNVLSVARRCRPVRSSAASAELHKHRPNAPTANRNSSQARSSATSAARRLASRSQYPDSGKEAGCSEGHPAFCPRGPNRAWYNSSMVEVSLKKEVSSSIIRDGQPEGLDNDWNDSSPEERIEAVWTLTKLCLAWNNHLNDEPRLQRTITRIQRSSR